MNRILVAVVIGLVFAVGIYGAIRLNNGSEVPPPADGTLVAPVAEEGSVQPRNIERAGQRIQLNPVLGKEAILVRERNADLQASQQSVTIVNEAATPVVQAAPTTPATTLIVPTQIPPTVAPVVVAGTCGQLTTRSHTVSDGETLFALTRLYSTSLVQLAEYGITEGDMVAGNVLNVPTSGCVCQSGRSHTVSAGQNVFRLAIQYGTTKEEIQRLNGLNASYLIRVGQVLCLP